MGDIEEQLRCQVCNDLASGIHFGVMVCRACAAFYRRSAVGNRRYVCRFNGNCEIGKDIRCCCRACRWAKCESIGMKSDVQRHRDRIGPRKKHSNDEQQSEIEIDGDFPTNQANRTNQANQAILENLNSTSSRNISSNSSVMHLQQAESFITNNNLHVDQDGRSFALLGAYNEFQQSSSFSSSFPMYIQPNQRSTNQAVGIQPSQTDQYPLISEMLRGYRKFVSLQHTTRNLDETTNFNKLFDEHIELIEGNHLDDIRAIRNSISLVSEMINEHFHPLEKFNTSIKWLLLRQFFCQFLIISRSYLSSKNFPELDDPRFMLTYNHFASLQSLDKVFAVENCKVEPCRMAEIFKPTMTRINAMVTNPMRKLNLSDEEFCGLMGLLFWNDTLSNLEAGEAQMVVNTQRKIVSELYTVCRSKVNSSLNASIRFGVLCNIVPLTSRFATEMASNFSLASMSNAFNVDDFIHLFIPQAF